MGWGGGGKGVLLEEEGVVEEDLCEMIRVRFWRLVTPKGTGGMWREGATH